MTKDTTEGGWKNQYRRVKGKLCVIIIAVAVIGAIVICDSVFVGVLFGTSFHGSSTAVQHRFCIEARGADEFGENTNDQNGLAIGHLKVDEEKRWISWKIKYQLSEHCGLSQWHIHGPIGTESPNAGVFRDLPSLPFGPAEELDQSGLLKGHIELSEKELHEFLHEPESFYLNFHSAVHLAAIEGDVEDNKKILKRNNNECYANGAMRGALNKICPNPYKKDKDDDDDTTITTTFAATTLTSTTKPTKPPHGGYPPKGDKEWDDDDEDDEHKKYHQKGKQSHSHYGDDDDHEISSSSMPVFISAFLALVTSTFMLY